MHFWNAYPFLRYVCFLIIGILLSDYFSQMIEWLLCLLAFSIVCYWILFFLNRKTNAFFIFYGITALAIIFFFGILRTHLHRETFYSHHILHKSDSISHYAVCISSEIQEREKNHRMEVEIYSIHTTGGWEKATGKVLLYIAKDSLSHEQEFTYGDKLLITGSPQPLKSAPNPQAFDYIAYLKNKNIFYQDYVMPDELILVGHDHSGLLYASALELRKMCDRTFQNLLQSEREYGIATAFVLGIKEGLDEEILTAYTDTGLMHVLAVSGFHIIFIVLILDFFLGFLKKDRRGIYAYTLIALLALWFYCILTGLSPSVLRAVLMYSFILLAQAFQRKSNIYNSLALSAFVLLCYDPMMLYNAGFQLSYLAVLGILYIYPKIQYWFLFENHFFNIGNKTWELLAVSIAAQMATFPLGLYYFAQFPNYFLLSNLLILPLSPLILYTGLLTLAFSGVPFLNMAFGFCLKWMIWGMNSIIFLLSSLPYSLSTGLRIGLWEMVIMYAAMASLLLMFHYRKNKYLLVSAVLVLVLSSLQCTQTWNQHHQKALVVYNIRSEPVLELVEGRKSILLLSEKLNRDSKIFDFSIRPHQESRGIQDCALVRWDETSSLHNMKDFGNYSLLVWQGRKILILKKKIELSQLEGFKNLEIEYCIIQNNAMKNFIFDKEEYKIKEFIVDSSNKPYIAEKISREAKERGFSIHSVGEEGAKLVDL